ncbi:MAG TPA: S24 family peptidase [Bacilli bacterium]|nr:S24 family peptidase [Bacilli bacterium]
MNLTTFAPMIGELFTTHSTTMYLQDAYPMIQLNDPDPMGRFVVQLGDDGLVNWGIGQGDYLVFRNQGWPNADRQLCFIQFGDEAILRIIPDLRATEIELVTANDNYAAISTHRNQFIVTGVCYDVLRAEDAPLIWM